MSSIEERLARDIEAVTGGVVVTDSDLRDARNAVDQRIASRRQRNRRLTVVAASAAVLLLVLGVTGVVTLGSEDKTAPPADPGPTPSQLSAEDEAFLTGSAPTPELLQGVWRLDGDVLLMRFSPPNFISFDNSGVLFDNPAVQGTYVVEGDLITVSVDGGYAGCGGQEFAMRASLPQEGGLRFVHTQPGTGNCAPGNQRWSLQQVLPTSEAMAELQVPPSGDWQPLGTTSLDGVWFAAGGGYLLEIDPGGTYYVADESGERVDGGRWSLRSSELTLASSAGSSECSQGNLLVLGNLETLSVGGDTPNIRGTVQRDDCGAAWAVDGWIRLSP
jgi:hypothetical protein